MRIAVRNGFAKPYDPGDADIWKGLLKAFTRIDPPFMSGVIIKIVFRFPRPKNHYHKNGQLKPGAPYFVEEMPDLDNLEKAVLDAMTAAFAWTDDKLVVDKSARKIYSKHPGVVIEIRAITQSDMAEDPDDVSYQNEE